MKACEEGKVRIELDKSTLARLLHQQELSVTEFRCLDCDSKQCVWQLCLTNCSKWISAKAASNQELLSTQALECSCPIECNESCGNGSDTRPGWLVVENY